MCWCQILWCARKAMHPSTRRSTVQFEIEFFGFFLQETPIDQTHDGVEVGVQTLDSVKISVHDFETRDASVVDGAGKCLSTEGGDVQGREIRMRESA